jgi:hypothetical protein
MNPGIETCRNQTHREIPKKSLSAFQPFEALSATSLGTVPLESARTTTSPFWREKDKVNRQRHNALGVVIVEHFLASYIGNWEEILFGFNNTTIKSL